jgi:putative phosphoribosyl transferase
MFDDRADAGKKLALELMIYAARNPLILAIPRGGVEVAYHVARRLDADLSLIVVRKLPFPTEPESGFGAVAEDGTVFLQDMSVWQLPQAEFDRIRRAQESEIHRRIGRLRQGKPLPPVTGRTVILIDDGIAMGSTTIAALQMCRRQGAAYLAVGVPVAGHEALEQVRQWADSVHVLEVSAFFKAVAQVYRYWRDVEDDEVLALMNAWQAEREVRHGSCKSTSCR